MRIVSVPVIHPDPVQLGAEVALHVLHQLPREAPQILHPCCVLGRDDEAKMVTVVFAAFREGLAVRLIRPDIEQMGPSPVASDALAPEIGDVPGEWC
jgi:hypothetical protein|nr:hypothetical protein [Acetobacter lovaniensis]